MQHVNTPLRHAILKVLTLRNLIKPAIGCGREAIGAMKRQLRKCARIKPSRRFAIRINLDHRTEQRPVERKLWNIKIALRVTLRATLERPAHLRCDVHSRGSGQRKSCGSWP